MLILAFSQDILSQSTSVWEFTKPRAIVHFFPFIRITDCLSFSWNLHNLTHREERLVVSNFKKIPKISSSVAQVEQYHGKRVRPQTIRSTLHKAGYHARIPYISRTDGKKRFKFTTEYVLKNSEFWSEIIFVVKQS